MAPVGECNWWYNVADQQVGWVLGRIGWFGGFRWFKAPTEPDDSFRTMVVHALQCLLPVYDDFLEGCESLILRILTNLRHSNFDGQYPVKLADKFMVGLLFKRIT